MGNARADVGKITGLLGDVEAKIGVGEDTLIDAPILDSVLGRD
jgi:hypothetical protein